MQREPGHSSGFLSIACEGCSKTVTYSAAEVGELAVVSEALPASSPAGAEVAAASAHPRPGWGRGVGSEATPGAVPESGPIASAARRRWRPWVLTAALAAAGIALVVIALLRSGDGSEPLGLAVSDGTSGAPPSSAPAGTAAPPQQVGAGSSDVRLESRTFLELFAIGVPRGWRSEEIGTEVRISSRRYIATIAIFHQLGERSPKDLAQGAADFLAGRHPGATIGKTEYLRIGGRRAARVNSSYGGGEEAAIVLADDGYTFVMLRSLGGGSPEAVATAAEAAIASFKPA